MTFEVTTDPSSCCAVTLECRGPIAVLELSNPQRRNAISAAMWKQIAAAAIKIGGSSGVRVLAIRGNGRAVFSAGADISEFQRVRGNAEDAAAYDRLVEQTVSLIEALPQPTVAMIHGPCLGAALSLAAACDFRFCDEAASFALPAVRLGLGYDVAGIHRIMRLVGVPAAKQILLIGRPIDAARAKEIGFVHAVVPSEGLEVTVDELADTLAANAPLAAAAMKATLRRLSEAHIPDFADCQELLSQCNQSADYQEGLAAFREKRKPRFTRR